MFEMIWKKLLYFIFHFRIILKGFCNDFNDFRIFQRLKVIALNYRRNAEFSAF